MIINTITFKAKKLGRDVKDTISWLLPSAMRESKADTGIYKRARLRELALRHQCVNLVETGTFFGQTVSALRKDFELLISIEIFEPLYHFNARQFRNHPNIEIVLGDSTQKIPAAIRACSDRRTIFWLDGHFSGGETGQGEKVCPILDEVGKIGALMREPCVIVIDDLRLFGTDPGYPSLTQLLDGVNTALNPDELYVDRDALVAVTSAER